MVLATDSGPTIKRYERDSSLKLDPYPVVELYLQRTSGTTKDADMELVFRNVGGETGWNSGPSTPTAIGNRC